MPTNDPTADAPELVKLPNSREAELSYTCPWCLQRTSCSLLSAAEFSLGQAWEVFALAKCGHARCKKMALVRFVTQTYWLQTQSPIPTPKTEVKVISIYPPPLRKYAPVGVPTEVAADMTEALGCFAHEYWVASAVVGRRALERGVEHKLAELPEVKPRSRDLVDQIDALRNLSTRMRHRFIK